MSWKARLEARIEGKALWDPVTVLMITMDVLTTEEAAAIRDDSGVNHKIAINSCEGFRKALAWLDGDTLCIEGAFTGFVRELSVFLYREYRSCHNKGRHFDLWITSTDGDHVAEHIYGCGGQVKIRSLCAESTNADLRTVKGIEFLE